MANTKSKVTKKTTKAPVKKEAVVKEPVTKVAEESTPTTSIVKSRVELDPNSIITVKNGYQGTLIYKSKKTGEKFVWESFGDEQDLELSELKSARNSSKAFFINNWFLIEDPDVINYLGVEQYYDNALSFDEFEHFILSFRILYRARASSFQKRRAARAGRI